MILTGQRMLSLGIDAWWQDATGSYGTPSYYVHKMLAASRLHDVVPIEVKTGELKLKMDGGTSVKGVNATAEVQDEKVTGNAAEYTYSARVRKTAGDGGLVVRFATQDEGGIYLAWFPGVKDRANTELWGGSG